MNGPDQISQSFETIFVAWILKFFDADMGSGMENTRIRDGRIRDKHSGSATLKNTVSYSKYYLKQILPPVGLELVPVRFDNVKEYGEPARAHVQLASAHNAGQLEENREPALDPDPVHVRNAASRCRWGGLVRTGSGGKEILAAGLLRIQVFNL